MNMNGSMLTNIPTIQRKEKCPVPDCPETFHVWEHEEKNRHLITEHKGFVIIQLRNVGLHAEASELAATP